MKKRLLFTSLLFSMFFLTSFKVKVNTTYENKYVSAFANPKSVCEFKGKKLYGKVQFVTSHADIKIQYVDSYADINVQMISATPTSCGQWQEVTSGADLKIQIVNSFPDLKVKLVTSSPGMN